MFFKDPKRSAVVGVGLLLLAVTAAVAYYLGRHQARFADQPPSEFAPAAAQPAPGKGVSSTSPGTNILAANIGPGVSEVLQLMMDWKQRHPSYHMTVETTGPGLSSTTEVFRFVKTAGNVVSRAKTQMTEPAALEFVLEAEGDRVRAYFPKVNQVVGINPAEETTRFFGQVGWAGGELDLTAPFKLAKASFVEISGESRALTLLFSGSLFQMPREAGDLFLTIHLDETGKTLSVEQLTLGRRVVSKINYLEEDLAQIQRKSPSIPATAIATQKTFKQALEDQAEGMKNTPGKRLSI
jgi:hypothetical protein